MGAYETERPVTEATPASVAFADQTVGSTSAARSVIVTNSGNAALTLGPGALTLAGTDATQFQITTNSCSATSLAPGGTCRADLTFAPTTTGARSAALVLTSNAVSNPTVALTGTGIAVPPPPPPPPPPLQPPAAPLSATFTTVDGPRTLVQWAGSLTQASTAGAVTGYWVSVNGSRTCTTDAAASQCILDTAYGPNATVLVRAVNAAGDSPATRATNTRAPQAVLFGTLRFAADSAKLTRTAKRTIRAYTAVLVSQGFTEVVLNGHAASTPTGTKSFRVTLSKQRAKAVRQIMRARAQALDAELRITIRARGGKDPIASNATKQGRAQNRRATINLW
jgi:outer membrane protein OmpA-like peptidoglycan-associated protein